MNTSSIQQFSPDNTALSAEHYQSFEMAKANDGIIGGDDIAQIRSYAAFARAQAQAIHKSIATMGELDDVAQAKAEMTETSQTFAKVSVYADQRIGEILRELPKAKNQHDASQVVGTPTSTRQAEKQAGIGHATSIDLQKMAANPEVVEAVIAKATEEGKVVSRNQVLKAIRERDDAREELEEAYQTNEILEASIANLESRVAQQPKPGVIEREVVPSDYEATKRENARLTREYQEMWKKKREADRKLEQANELLGEKSRNDNAQRSIEQLTIATNAYLSQYGGKVWAFDQFSRVDEVAQQEFTKAINNLAAFAQNLAQMIQEFYSKG